MEKIVGQCHCGKNKFEINGEPEFQFICYCTDCRVLNGGGHLCGMMFDESALSSAEFTQKYAYQGGSADPVELHFCPDCATQLYAYPRHYQGKVVIRANVLNKEIFNSQQNLFSESSFSWDR